MPDARVDAARGPAARPAGAVAQGYRLAHALAYAINPLVLPPLLLGLVLAHFGAPAAEVAWSVTLAAVFFAFIPVGYVLWLVRRRSVASVELRERRHRTVPFLVGLGSAAAALPLLQATGTTAVALVAALVGCHLLNTVLILLINLRWKISVHTAALSGFISILYFVAATGWHGLAPDAVLLRPPAVGALLPALPLLMWARVRTGAHTRGQVVAGALFGLVVPYVELRLLWHAGVLAGL